MFESEVYFVRQLQVV